MQIRRIISWFLTVAIVLPILVSCKDTGDSQLGMDILDYSLDTSHSEESRNEAKRLLGLQKNVQKLLRRDPIVHALPSEHEEFVVTVEEATTFHNDNKQGTLSYLDQEAEALKNLADNVKYLSKIKFAPKTGKQKIAETETLVVLNLLALRDLSAAAARKILNLMVEFDKSYFDNIEGNKEMKEKLFVEYSKTLAIGNISGNDLKRTLQGLQEMREEGALTPALEETITKVVAHFSGNEKAQQEHLKKMMETSTTEKAQNTLFEAMKKYHSEIESKSFLYDPALKDHPLLHVIVIVSNLTWGLCNTLVGLGFVITAVLAVPFTWAANTIAQKNGMYPLFRKMRLPKLAIAESNMQIYADVCGLGFIPSKMSAGLFELDFCTYKSFASHHEAGHAKQSALLGPLYFPAAILSYILNMGHGGFIEDWADVWATKRS